MYFYPLFLFGSAVLTSLVTIFKKIRGSIFLDIEPGEFVFEFWLELYFYD